MFPSCHPSANIIHWFQTTPLLILTNLVSNQSLKDPEREHNGVVIRCRRQGCDSLIVNKSGNSVYPCLIGNWPSGAIAVHLNLETCDPIYTLNTIATRKTAQWELKTTIQGISIHLNARSIVINTHKTGVICAATAWKIMNGQSTSRPQISLTSRGLLIFEFWRRRPIQWTIEAGLNGNRIQH